MPSLPRPLWPPQVELEEIESQAEEYPLTRSFLVLMTSLLDTPIPLMLGAGHRVPGFDPYLEFVRDSVFLKFDSRAYHSLEEKVSSTVDLLSFFRRSNSPLSLPPSFPSSLPPPSLPFSLPPSLPPPVAGSQSGSRGALQDIEFP